MNGVHFSIGRLLLVWVWRVEEAEAWGFALSKRSAKQKAQLCVEKYRPDLRRGRLGYAHEH